MGPKKGDEQMLNTRKWTGILIATLVSFEVHAGAAQFHCQSLLLAAKSVAKGILPEGALDTLLTPSESPKVVDHLPKVSDLPLPQKALELIDHHSFSKLKSLFSESDLLIQIRSLGQGERIQANFLSKVLSQVFPSAKLDLNPPSEFDKNSASSNKKIILKINDSHENELNTTAQSVEMRILKSANPTLYSVDRDQVRQAIGLSKSAKVLHIYFTGFRGGLENPMQTKDQLGHIISQIEKELPKFDLIFLSHTGLLNKGDSGLRAQPDRLLSQLRYDDIKNLGLKKRLRPLVVLNNTGERMPLVHALSNLTIVRGPINFFEALNVGTPTLLYHHEQLHDYDWNAFSEMVEKGHKRSHFHFTSERSDLIDAAKSLLNVRVERPQIDEESFKDLLDHLERVILEQTSGRG